MEWNKSIIRVTKKFGEDLDRYAITILTQPKKRIDSLHNEMLNNLNLSNKPIVFYDQKEINKN